MPIKKLYQALEATDLSPGHVRVQDKVSAPHDAADVDVQDFLSHLHYSDISGISPWGKGVPTRYTTSHIVRQTH